MTITPIVFSIGLVINLTLIFFSFRASWVNRRRMDFLVKNDIHGYLRLPSYDYMLFHFWVWDVKKFIQEEK